MIEGLPSAHIRMQHLPHHSPDSPLRSAARAWVIRLASGQATQDEIDSIHKWIAAHPDHATAFSEERKLWKELKFFRATLEAPEEPRILPVMPARVGMHRPRLRRISASIAAIAACGMLLMYAPDLLLRLRADHVTGHGEVATYSLSDGSRIALDADSAIALHFTDKERRIDLLKGRIWINARHDARRPLFVAALGGSTRDVGTAFAVERLDGRVDIGVTQGEVSVGKDNGAGSLHLTEGQVAHYLENGAPLRDSDVAVDDIAAWRMGEIIIRHAALDDALRTVARYRHGATYILADLHDAPPVDAALRTDQPDDGIASLAQAHKLAVRHLPGNILLITAKNSQN